MTNVNFVCAYKWRLSMHKKVKVTVVYVENRNTSTSAWTNSKSILQSLWKGELVPWSNLCSATCTMKLWTLPKLTNKKKMLTEVQAKTKANSWKGNVRCQYDIHTPLQAPMEYITIPISLEKTILPHDMKSQVTSATWHGEPENICHMTQRAIFIGSLHTVLHAVHGKDFPTPSREETWYSLQHEERL